MPVARSSQAFQFHASACKQVEHGIVPPCQRPVRSARRTCFSLACICFPFQRYPQFSHRAKAQFPRHFRIHRRSAFRHHRRHPIPRAYVRRNSLANARHHFPTAINAARNRSSSDAVAIIHSRRLTLLIRLAPVTSRRHRKYSRQSNRRSISRSTAFTISHSWGWNSCWWHIGISGSSPVAGTNSHPSRFAHAIQFLSGNTGLRSERT